MNETSECMNKEAIGPYIKKRLTELGIGDLNWLGEEVYRRVNHGEEPVGQDLATCHYQIKQWVGDVKGSHVPAIDALVALSGILGKSLNEILAGQDLNEDEQSHLSLYSVARANNEAFYAQLCALEIEAMTDEYGKSLLDYVLEFRSERILLAMLKNPLNSLQLFETYAVDPANNKAVSLADFLPMAVKNQDLFLKLYPSTVPWSLHLEKTEESNSIISAHGPKGMADLLGQKWARDLLMKEYAQKHFEWIDKVNHCHVEGPYSNLPYLCGAFNVALEVSLQNGDMSLAQFGIAHNQALINDLLAKKIPLEELKIDTLGWVEDRGRPVATLAYLPPEICEALKDKNEMRDVLRKLMAAFQFFGEQKQF